MTSTTARQTRQDEAAVTLRALFPIGSTVQTKLLHVSRSGMLRSFAVLVASPGSETIRDVSHLVADAIGARVHKPTGGVAMGGCGMDMGYALAYSLSRSLYRDGFPCTGSQYGWIDPELNRWIHRCPSNDHVNDDRPDYGYDRMHSDPGYALSHRHV